MPKLIVNPGTDAAFELVLKPGINSLGRSAENDLPVNHESVATRQCEIHVGESEVTILDLGSESKTRVEGTLVEQAVLVDGQNLTLGQVALQFRGDPGPVGTGAKQAAPLPIALDCRFHPKTPARYFCNRCAKAYCPICVGRQMVEGQMRVTCHKCGLPCIELELQIPDVKPPPFRELAAGAFRYPLRGESWVLLLAGVLFFVILDLLKYGAALAGLYGGFAVLILAIFGAGNLVAYMQRIVAGSAMGDDRMPDWPDFSNWQDDIAAPLFQTGAILAVCCWPLVLLRFLNLDGQPTTILLLALAAILGLLYLPMGMLAVYMADTITALDPRIVIPAIVRLRGHYWIVCTLVGAVVLTSWGLRKVLNSWLPIPVLPALLSGFASLYFLTVEMRLLGLMHWCNRERLGWVKGA